MGMKYFFQGCKLFCIVVLSLTPKLATAQTLSPSTTNAAGGTAPILGNIFDWSIGEMALVSTFSSPSLIVTQGVLQPDTLSPTWVKMVSTSLDLKVIPNPAKDVLGISFNSVFNGSFEFQLIDMSGKIVLNPGYETHAGENNYQLPINGIAEGNYLLKTLFTNKNESKEGSIFSIQIIK